MIGDLLLRLLAWSFCATAVVAVAFLANALVEDSRKRRAARLACEAELGRVYLSNPERCVRVAP